MCYSNCPYENFYGECKGNRFFSKIDAHCNTDFVCKHCGEGCREEMQGDIESVCFECEEKYKEENEID